MNFPNAIAATFESIFDDRFFPNTFPQTEPAFDTWPAGRYTIVNELPPEDVCGTGNGDQDDVRVQIDICALTFDSMWSLRQAVIDAAEGGLVVAVGEMPCPVRREGGFTDYDRDAKVHRAVLDFVLSPSSN